MGVAEWAPIVVVEAPPARTGMLEVKATDETLMRTGEEAGEEVVGGETLKGDARNRMVQAVGSSKEGVGNLMADAGNSREDEGEENLMVGAGGSVVAEGKVLAGIVPQMLKMRVIFRLWGQEPFETKFCR